MGKKIKTDKKSKVVEEAVLDEQGESLSVEQKKKNA